MGAFHSTNHPFVALAFYSSLQNWERAYWDRQNNRRKTAFEGWKEWFLKFIESLKKCMNQPFHRLNIRLFQRSYLRFQNQYISMCVNSAHTNVLVCGNTWLPNLSSLDCYIHALSLSHTHIGQLYVYILFSVQTIITTKSCVWSTVEFILRIAALKSFLIIFPK